MRLVILDSCPAVGEWSAKYVSKRINEFNPGPNKYFVLGLPTGSTPLGMYKKLIEFHKAGKLSFKYVKTFNMDEYVDIPRDHPESYHYFMWNNFFKHIDIDPANVHILDGNATDLVAECNAFEKKISEAGGIELFIGGIGPDGHIAFNEPGSSLVSRTRIKTLAQDTIEANARFFGNDISKVPRQALTVGVGTVMDSNEVLILVTGAHKSFALYKAIEEGVNHMWTVSAFQQHPNTLMICDEDATLELRVKTVKYFKNLEPAKRMIFTEGYFDPTPAFLCNAVIDPNIKNNEQNSGVTSPRTICRCNKQEQENKLLKASLSKIHHALEEQNTILNKHSELLNKLLEKAFPNSVDLKPFPEKAFPNTIELKIFPISTKEGLEEVEQNLTNYSEELLNSHIRKLIGPGPIHKCMNLFFTEELILLVNWDGNQKKVALKKYKLFNTFVFEAVKNDDFGYPNFEKAMRVGLRKAKNAIYKKSFVLRNKTVLI